MTDIDRLLRDDATRWSESPLATPPNLEAAAQRAIGDAGVSSRSRYLVAVSGSAVAVIVVTAIAIGASRHHAPQSGPTQVSPAASSDGPLPVPAGVPSSVVNQSGVRLPYAGAVPWSNAIRDPNDPNAIYVMADWSALSAAKGLCAVPTERVAASGEGSKASILVAGYALPSLPSGVACGGTEPLPQQLRVDLPGGTSPDQLIDAATSASHSALDPASAPAIASLPSGLGSRTVRWDEETGVITSTYPHPPGGSIWLDSGTPTALNQQNPPHGAIVTTFLIGDATATIHRVGGRNQFAVYWQATPSRAYVLNVGLPASNQQISLAEVESLCRSVR